MSKANATGSALRSWLLFRRRLDLRGDGERAELGGELDGVEVLAGAGPELGSELQVALARPVWKDAVEVAQVELGGELGTRWPDPVAFVAAKVEVPLRSVPNALKEFQEHLRKRLDSPLSITEWARLVRPLRLVEDGGSAALDSFIDDCAKASSGMAGAQRERLRQLSQRAAALPDADPSGRVAHVETAARLFAEVRATAPAVPEGLAALFEDGLWRPSDARLGGAPLALVEELGRVLQPQVVERADHRRLVDAFVVRFGAGGRCSDVAAFLDEIARELAVLARETAPRPVTAPALPATALVQLAKSESEDLLVLNPCWRARALVNVGQAPASSLARPYRRQAGVRCGRGCSGAWPAATALRARAVR